MLLGTRLQTTDHEATYGSVHNYYERLVFEQIAQDSNQNQKDPNFESDVACVALNHLPPRYVRYDVDMTFFLSQIELEEINKKVQQAVQHALDYVALRNAQKSADPT